MEVVTGLNIITCKEWGAKLPKRALTLVDGFERIILHHTAGHWHELDHLPTESLGEARNYVRSIQNMHMAPGGLGAKDGGSDTGQNFTVCRNGLCFEGRHRSIEAITKGKMVLSAHCPDQNDQPGIEVEHLGSESMTAKQYATLVLLCAWIQKCGKNPGSSIKGHKDYYATACPANLYSDLPKLRADVTAKMKAPKPKPKPPKEPMYTIFMIDMDGKEYNAITPHPGDWLGKFGIKQHNIALANIERK